MSSINSISSQITANIVFPHALSWWPFSQHQVNTAQHPTRTSANDILQWHLSLVPVFLPSLFKQLIGQTHICPFFFFPVTIPEGWMKTLVPGRCRAGAAPATSSRHGTGSDTSSRFFSVLKDHDIRSNQKKNVIFPVADLIYYLTFSLWMYYIYLQLSSTPRLTPH
jgi:hypothetical protein